MKKIAFISFVLVLLSIQLQAQTIEVTETEETFSTGKHQALSTVIYDRELSDVSKDWKTYLKSLKAEKVNDGKKEMFADNAVFPDLGNNPVDVYTVFKEDKSKKQITLVVAIDLGGAYMNAKDHADKQKAIKKIMKDFAFNQSKEGLNDSKTAEEKKLAKLQDEQKELEKENADLKKDIENNKNKITKAEKDIVTTEAELDKKKGEVSVQKKIVDASSDAVSEQAKASKKIYDKLLDQQKDIEKKKENLKDDIKDYNKKIEKDKEEITKNEKEQETKKKEIEDQNDKIKAIKKKLDDLK